MNLACFWSRLVSPFPDNQCYCLAMAPDPKKLSAKRGKARLYLCSVCKTRHTSPTGAKCNRQPKRRADDSSDDGGYEKRRRTSLPGAASSPRRTDESSDE